MEKLEIAHRGNNDDMALLLYSYSHSNWFRPNENHH